MGALSPVSPAGVATGLGASQGAPQLVRSCTHGDESGERNDDDRSEEDDGGQDDGRSEVDVAGLVCIFTSTPHPACQGRKAAPGDSDDEGNDDDATSYGSEDEGRAMFHQEVEELEREKRSTRNYETVIGRMQHQKAWGNEEE